MNCENQAVIFDIKQNKSAHAYSKCRIPGIVITKKNTVLTYFEGRSTGSDWAQIDIVLLRSTNSGKSFSEPVIISDGISGENTVNNPVMIVGSDNTIHFLYCVSYGVESFGGGVFYRKSTDDGITWSKAQDISRFTSPEIRNCFALGPGHGICMKNSTLAVPVWLVRKDKCSDPHSHHPAQLHILYSVDNALSFTLSDKIPDATDADPNETAAAELPDGKLILDIRTDKYKYRCFSTGDLADGSFSELKPNIHLPDPVCFGSIAAVRKPTGEDILLNVNCAHKKARKNLTVKQSSDNGKSWERIKVICKSEAGYSDIATDKDANVYVLYETANCEKLTLAKFSL